ncbi:hypothetical protein BG004_005334 [Podila humilis]|nr:hypothetical protein BG004_005334 [Podila humilis]
MLLKSITVLSTVILGLTMQAQAHSWLDCANSVGNTCKGYPLGYPTRANPDINTLYTYLVSGRVGSAPVCQPGRQQAFAPNSVNPALPPPQVAPGGVLHLTWQVNGHLNEQKPTVVEIYWPGVNKPGKTLKTRSELTKKTLLTKMGFASSKNCDDPKHANTWCHGQVKIPSQTKEGKYQMIWWWKFDQNPIGEEYSTCFEVIVKKKKTKKRQVKRLVA